MSQLVWDETGNHFYEAGIDRGVFYPKNSPGVAWNGLASVKEAPSGIEVTENFFDGVKYWNQLSLGNFAAIIEAFTYPDEFSEYDGSLDILTNQPRKTFGFCYRTKIGNDVDDVNHGYKLHLIYNALVSPTSRDYVIVKASPEATIFSWTFSTTPVSIPNAYLSSHLIADSTVANPQTMSALEDALYGTVDTAPYLPSVEDVIALFEANSILRVTDNGDGSFTVIGPDEAIIMLDGTSFQISWPTAIIIDSITYKISSL